MSNLNTIPVFETSTTPTKENKEIFNDKIEYRHSYGCSLFKEFLSASQAGMGMFVESYFIFAIGNINNIWKILYPSCYVNFSKDCDHSLVNSISYIEITAIIIGMIGFGLAADHMGRLWGSRMTISCMGIGSIGFTAAYYSNLTEQFAIFVGFMILFSFGVGGEYPMAGSTASEKSEEEKTSRGKTVVLAFAMQGWGNFINSCIICILLLLTNTGGCSRNMVTKVYNGSLIGECSEHGLELVWRLQYGLGIPIIIWLVYLRFFVHKESKVWKLRQEKSLETHTPEELRIKRWRNTLLLFSEWTYVKRLIGCAVGWFVWDVAFYGNKLFQGTIIQAIVGGTDVKDQTLISIMSLTVLNSFVSLIGYYFAAYTIDRPWMGRKRMQNMGFIVITIVSLSSGYMYKELSQNIPLFQAMYFISSFFMQFGPNATTFLLPVELFPTDIRSQAHGISAAAGKAGALFSALLFTFGENGKPVPPQMVFLISGYSCFIGLGITICFVQDMTGIPLSQVDEKWNKDYENRHGRSSKAVMDQNTDSTAPEVPVQLTKSVVFV